MKNAVDNDSGSWEHVNFDNNLPYPLENYPLSYSVYDKKNWLISFNLSSGGKLFVPCLEYYTRCYGVSSEIKRTLLTYPWDNNGFNGQGKGDSLQRRIFSKLREPILYDKYQVNLGTRMVRDDVYFAAYLKYEFKTRMLVKKLCAQLASEYTNIKGQKEKPIFLKVPPWHTEKGRLEVEGIPLGENSFLALRVSGSSLPKKVEYIERQESNSSNIDDLAKGKDEELPQGHWPQQGPPKKPPITGTGDLAPDNNSETVEIMAHKFKFIGVLPVVTDKKLTEQKTRGNSDNVKDSKDKHSSGDPTGKNKGVGGLSSSSLIEYKGYGVLIDLWETLNKMKDSPKYKNSITEVQWYVPSLGYGDSEPLRLIPIPTLDRVDLLKFTHLLINKSNKDVDEYLKKINSWNSVTRMSEDKFIRGVLIIRIKVKGQYLFLVEIERRQNNQGEHSETQSTDKEKYSGLIFSLRDPKKLDDWLNTLLNNTAFFLGIMSKSASLCPGDAHPYQHRKAAWEEWHQEASIIKALSNIGIDLKDLSAKKK